MSDFPKQPVARYLIGFALLAYLLLAAVLIVVFHLNIISIINDHQFLRANLICGAFGMLGSSVAAIRKYYRWLITESQMQKAGKEISPLDWSWGWIYYYICKPLIGYVLGAMIYTLTAVSLKIFSEPILVGVSTEGRCLLYGISFLAGYSGGSMLDRLEYVSEQLFKRS